MDKKIVVGIADMQYTRGEGTLITYALGSCIGVSFYDPVLKLGALLHIMLPCQESKLGAGNPFKFADTGIQETLRKLAAFGANKSRMICKIAGGARMFDFKTNSIGDVGGRNAESVKKALREAGIRITGEDTGADYARTMEMNVATGEVRVRSFGKQESVL